MMTGYIEMIVGVVGVVGVVVNVLDTMVKEFVSSVNF